MLDVQKISLCLRNTLVLDAIDLRLGPGLTAIIGPNGSGKTSLLRVVAGLLAPEHGHVRWRGQNICEMHPQKRAQSLSYLMQTPQIHWPISVQALITLGRTMHTEPAAKQEAAVARAMDLCAARSFAARPIHQVSGGERARVLLARALCVEADLLLVDEPTASLDPAHQLAMMEILAAEGSSGKTVLCVLHDLSLAARFADHIVVLNHGTISHSGKPKDVLCAPKMEQVFGLRFDTKGHLA